MSCVCTWEWNSKMRGCQQHIRFLTPVLTRTCFERSHSGFVKCLYMSLLSLLLICFSNCWGGLFYLGFTYLSMRGHSVHCFTFQFCLYPSVVAFLLLDVRWYVGGIFPKWIFSQVLERWFFFFFCKSGNHKLVGCLSTLLYCVLFARFCPFAKPHCSSLLTLTIKFVIFVFL